MGRGEANPGSLGERMHGPDHRRGRWARRPSRLVHARLTGRRDDRRSRSRSVIAHVIHAGEARQLWIPRNGYRSTTARHATAPLTNSLGHQGCLSLIALSGDQCAPPPPGTARGAARRGPPSRSAGR